MLCNSDKFINIIKIYITHTPYKHSQTYDIIMEESGFYDLSLQEQIVFALDCIDSYDYIRSFSYIINEQDRHTIHMVYRNRLKETLDRVQVKSCTWPCQYLWTQRHY